MSGFGRGFAQSEEVEITVEIKSLNGKALRVRYSLPRLLNPLIGQVRKLVESSIKRGEVELFVSYSFSPNFKVPIQINYAEAEALIRVAEKLSRLSGREVGVSLKEILSLSDSIVKKDVEVSIFKEPLLKALKGALAELDRERKREGEELKHFFYERLKKIEELLREIEESLPQIQKKLKEKLREKVKELLSEGELERRLELEIALLAEKQDVSEEISRLKAHIKRFKQLLETEDEPVGKRLDFLCQEMHREITTLGNKVKEIDITEPILEIKAEIAKMKEQAQNVE